MQKNINEISNNKTSKKNGYPRGHAPFMKNGEKSWQVKIEYWRKILMKIIGYEIV